MTPSCLHRPSSPLSAVVTVVELTLAVLGAAVQMAAPPALDASPWPGQCGAQGISRSAAGAALSRGPIDGPSRSLIDGVPPPISAEYTTALEITFLT